MEIVNAKIAGTKLGEDHGCLTVMLTLEGDCWGCGYGGYCLDHWFADPGCHHSSDGYGAIIELMKTLEVDSWEQLKGKVVRVEFDNNNTVIKIGASLTNKWFSFKDYFEAVKTVKTLKEL